MLVLFGQWLVILSGDQKEKMNSYKSLATVAAT